MQRKRRIKKSPFPREHMKNIGKRTGHKSDKEGIGVWGVTVGNYEYYVQFLGRKSMIGPSIKRHFNTENYVIDKYIPRDTLRLIIDIDKNYDLEYKICGF